MMEEAENKMKLKAASTADAACSASALPADSVCDDNAAALADAACDGEIPEEELPLETDAVVEK